MPITPTAHISTGCFNDCAIVVTKGQTSYQNLFQKEHNCKIPHLRVEVACEEQLLLSACNNICICLRKSIQL
jgi:hypothetical protein